MVPNRDDILSHLQWLAQPARGAYDDALIEIAYEKVAGDGPRQARLFGLDELEQAADFAIQKNSAGVNVYVGASLKQPDAERCSRTSGADFYCGTAVPVDVDADYDRVRARMAAIVEDGLEVVTGTVPERRTQHWVRLDQPCDDLDEYQQAFAALVLHVGADAKARDAARVMRLAGTISYPPERKVAKGYQVELTRLSINADARSASIERLTSLDPKPVSDSGGVGQHAHAGVGQDIKRGAFDRVVDGREAYWRDIVFAVIAEWQQQHGADPTEGDVWAEAWSVFEAKADLRDGRWSGEGGQRELRKRIRNSLRRLRAGHLGRFGLASIETGAGEAEAARAREEQSGAEEGEGAHEQQCRSGFDTETEHKSEESAHGRSTSTAETKFKFLDFRQLPDGRISWLVEDLLPEGAFAVLYGKPGSFKSFAALYLSTAIATGLDAFGKATKDAPVLYVAMEGQRGMKARVSALITRYGLPRQLPLRFLTSTLNLRSTLEDAKQLIADIKTFGMPFEIIVIDTLAWSFAGGNENASEDMGAFIRNIGFIQEQTGAAVLVVHHCGKDETRGMRGHSSLFGAIDAEFEIKRDGNEKDPENRLGLLKVTKQKNGEDGVEFPFKMEPILAGFWHDTPTLVLVPIDAMSPQCSFGPMSSRRKKMSPDQQLCLQALQRAVDEAGEIVTTHQYGQVRAVKATTYITYVRQMMPTKETKRQTETASRCLNWLQANGRAVAWGGFVWAI